MLRRTTDNDLAARQPWSRKRPTVGKPVDFIGVRAFASCDQSDQISVSSLSLWE